VGVDDFVFVCYVVLEVSVLVLAVFDEVEIGLGEV